MFFLDAERNSILWSIHVVKAKTTNKQEQTPTTNKPKYRIKNNLKHAHSGQPSICRQQECVQ